MRAQEFIVESLSQPYPWERSMNAGYFRTADDEIVQVQFDQMGDPRYDVWAVSFNRGTQFDLTGTGDEFRVFATVIAIIKQWVSQANPAVLTFSADKSEGNRAGIYRRMVQRLIGGSEYVDVTGSVDRISDAGIQSTMQQLIRASGSSHEIFVLARRDLVGSALSEDWGIEKYPIPLPIGDYLASGSDEFAPPGNYRNAEDLHHEVYDLIGAGVEPAVVPVDPKQLLATQDWLSNAGGGEPLFDEYPDRPVVYEKQGKYYILDGHHRTTRAWKNNRPISVYLFSDQLENDQDLNENNDQMQWVYHASYLPDLAAGLDSVLRRGLVPSKTGYSGPGVYFARHPSETYYHVSAEDAIMFRAKWSDLVKLYGTYPSNPQGIQHDDDEIVVPGAVPAQYLEVEFFPGEWWPVDTAAAAAEEPPLDENFADGKKPGRKGLSKRVGVNCKQSVTQLRKIAAKSSGERQRMAHWCANMKSGRNK